MKLIGNIVKPGNNVVNLGSHIGFEAIIMGKIIGPTGRMFIFEPYVVSHRIVTKNMELNGLKNYTTVYNKGASNEKSKGTFTINQKNTGASYILPPGEVKK
jgi:FkbM family methyltransferase